MSPFARCVAPRREDRTAILAVTSVAGLAMAVPVSRGADLAPVVVLATRASESSLDVPASVDRIDRDRIATGQPQVNLSETLAAVPGVVAQSRQNYAQDLQVSVRGFGARSGFGVRGVRLYADGIPATMPDGQGQVSHFDLGSAGHIEVLRGPFSVLYGNASGGVIALFTDDAPPGGEVGAAAAAGTYGTRRYALNAGIASGATNGVFDASHFETDGYRNHSRAERNLLNARFRIELPGGGDVSLLANAVESPFVQDPLGLTRAQWTADPTQPGSGALDYNTRKSLAQEQVGLAYHHSLGARADLTATVYGGHRQTVQFQAIPAASEARLTHPGGVIDLGREYSGVDLRATARLRPADTDLQVTGGLSYDRLVEARRGYLNFVGAAHGVQGEMRRDDANVVKDLDPYVEAQWRPNSRWQAVAGLRRSTVDVSSHNRLAVGAADSGVRYAATSPAVGATVTIAAPWRVYAAYGRGFETPTLNELAYRSTDGSLPGLNLALRPTTSDHWEVGSKFATGSLAATIAVFDVQTRDELAVATSSGGRSVYRNIASTRRRGAELSLNAQLGRGWSALAAYTELHAATASAYSTCVGLPCVVTSVPSGNALPAVPRHALYASLGWRSVGGSLATTVETLRRSAIYVDDLNSDSAPGYWVVNAHATVRQSIGRWQLTESLRVDNVADRRYVGSVIVNDSNGRFFEPAAGRALSVILTAAFR